MVVIFKLVLFMQILVVDKIEGNSSKFHEFEVTGSTYEPIGDM